jgi:hypothetical protein
VRAFKQNLSVSVVSAEFASTALKALSPQSPVVTSANWAIDLQHVGVSWIEIASLSGWWFQHLRKILVSWQLGLL